MNAPTPDYPPTALTWTQVGPTVFTARAGALRLSVTAPAPMKIADTIWRFAVSSDTGWFESASFQRTPDEAQRAAERWARCFARAILGDLGGPPA